MDWLCFEKAAKTEGYSVIAGVDEAGRGPLAGPVAAAACVLPDDSYLPGVNDCKKLTPQQRQYFYEAITQDTRIQWAVALVEPDVIDRINILQATIQAMIQAVDALTQKPDRLLVDGLNLPHPTIPCQRIIKGDTLSASIAYASILAKVVRDRIMVEAHERYPQYGFHRHKGYGTEAHLEALAQYGPCPIHRLSFAPVAQAQLATQ